MTTQNEWSTKEKSIAQIIKELNTFEDQELTVMTPAVKSVHINLGDFSYAA